MRWITLMVVILLLIPLVSGITVEQGVVFQDGTYTYTTSTTYTVTTMNVTAQEFYLNQIGFCSAEENIYLTTTRPCGQELICENIYGMFLNFISIIVLLSAIAVLIMIIGIFTGMEVNLSFFAVFVGLFIMSLLLIAFGGMIVDVIC